MIVFRNVFVLLICSLIACQDEISFETENNGLLIVDGSISDRVGMHTIRLATSAEFSSNLDENVEEPVSGAIVAIEDNKGNVVNLTESSPGFYDTPQGYQAIGGNAYVLCITTPDGAHYQSDAELLRPSGDMDEVYYDVETKEVLSAENIIVEEQRVNFYTDFSFPERDVYYKWEWDGVYAFKTTYITSEQRAPFCIPRIPTGIPEVCYVKEKSDGGFVKVLESNTASSLDYEKFLVLSKKVDFNWKVRYAMHLVQLSMTKNTYEFWKNVEEQRDRSGSIFDPVPSKIIGNVHNVTNDGEEVLGNFSVYGYQDQRVFVTGLAIPDSNNSCLLPLTIPGESHPEYCCNCSKLDPTNNQTAKPDFWVD